LSHAIEAIVSPFAMPQTDALAFSAVKLIVDNIGPAVANGSNMAARENMAMAALEAGLAGNAWVGGIHALGHQLSTQYGMAHGVAIGIMMPYVMNFNLIACIDRFKDIAIAMGESVDGLSKIEAAHKAPLAVLQLLKSIGLPTTLKEAGANPDQIHVCAKWALEDIDIPGNPRTLTLDQIEELYQMAFAG
jgi:alcohol dehydrogenase class IV